MPLVSKSVLGSYEYCLPGLIRPLTGEACDRILKTQEYERKTQLLLAAADEQGRKKKSIKKPIEAEAECVREEESTIALLSKGVCPLCTDGYGDNIEDHLAETHKIDSHCVKIAIMQYLEKEKACCFRPIYENTDIGRVLSLRWGEWMCSLCSCVTKFNLAQDHSNFVNHLQTIHGISSHRGLATLSGAHRIGFVSGLTDRVLAPARTLNMSIFYGCRMCGDSPVFVTLNRFTAHLNKVHRIYNRAAMWHMGPLCQGFIENIRCLASHCAPQISPENEVTLSCPFCEAWENDAPRGDAPPYCRTKGPCPDQVRYTVGSLQEHIEAEHRLTNVAWKLATQLAAADAKNCCEKTENWVSRKFMQTNSKAVKEVRESWLEQAAYNNCPDSSDKWCGCYPVTLQVLRDYRAWIAGTLSELNEKLPTNCGLCGKTLGQADVLNHLACSHNIDVGFHILLRLMLQYPFAPSDGLTFFVMGFHILDWKAYFYPDREASVTLNTPGDQSFCPFCLTAENFLSPETLSAHLQCAHLIEGTQNHELTAACFDTLQTFPVDFDFSSGLLYN